MSAGELDLYGGEVVYNTVVLFESFVLCFPCKRMMKISAVIVLVVIKKTHTTKTNQHRKARVIKGWISLMMDWFYA